MIDDLEDLLVAEHRAIQAGDLAALAAFVRRKTALVEALAGIEDRLATSRLAGVRERAETNRRLLASVLSGVKAARARYDLVRQAGTRLETYDQSGRRQSVAFGAGTVERRA
ncbi:hypothetical protein [Albidovulum salinarum]|uniref:hypothetical protein n=1 Tax=Albidovulum salinarum TaxID=2984153 RepID=UPI0021DFEC11|nr:hypothetical protein [Defluviimonas sp. WL0024]